MIRNPKNLTPAEQHAANDLALYTVNTSALYPAAKDIMARIAKQGKAPGANEVHPYWVGHAKKGGKFYKKQMGADEHTALFLRDHVLHAAAFQIAEHYAEEQSETNQQKAD